MDNVKFMYNGIKADGKLHKGFYSKGDLISFPAGTITIYAKDYARLPQIEGLTIQNETDIMTDYFDSDHVRVSPENKFYSLVNEAYEKQEAKRKANKAKRGYGK